MNKFEMLDKWFDEICYNKEKYVKLCDESAKGSPDYSHRKKFCIYTELYIYNISAEDRKADEGYLGCIVTTRKPRAGEDWNRGNDLPDGKFNYETWTKIKDAIIRYELIPLSVPKESKIDLPHEHILTPIPVYVKEDKI